MRVGVYNRGDLWKLILIVIMMIIERRKYLPVLIAVSMVLILYGIWVGIIYHYIGIVSFSHLSVKHAMIKNYRSC